MPRAVVGREWRQVWPSAGILQLSRGQSDVERILEKAAGLRTKQKFKAVLNGGRDQKDQDLGGHRDPGQKETLGSVTVSWE